ncbi:fibronectin type III domain-containing protein [Maricaulis sp. D1M11]|uniref:fibronectin type III domain-containing protein n=1 Tax=Maricaulis sp. D1M11 TaxID=3076117 RepID=UPI0039B4EF7F
MRVLLSLFAFVLLSVPAGAHPSHHRTPPPPWQAASDWPDRIATTFVDDPHTSVSVTWRTDVSVDRTRAEIALATDDARFDLTARSSRATTRTVNLEHWSGHGGERFEVFNIGLGYVNYHEVTFEGLEPDTLYAIRVKGGDGNWSEWFQVRTAPERGPVEFIYFGDAQNSIRQHWSRLIRSAHATAPQADFYLHAGDLVHDGSRDRDWAEWFDAGDFLHAQTPIIPVVGNHEYPRMDRRADGSRNRSLNMLWRPQFALPVVEELPEPLHETVYDVRWSEDLHVFVLNSAAGWFEEQAEWLDRKLAQTDAQWTVVTMHHPFFAQPRDRSNADSRAREAAFLSVIERHSVDMVLVGHMHFYGRLTSGRTSRVSVGEGDAVDTVFVISAGTIAQSDPIDADFLPRVGDGQADLDGLSADRVAENTPLFQVIRLDGDHLEYEAYTATGRVYDAFSLQADEGHKRLVNGDAAYGETRLFEQNTGPWAPGERRPHNNWEDLRGD